MRLSTDFENDYLWKLIQEKRTFYQPDQGRMSIQDLNNLVIPCCLDFLPITGTIKRISDKYPIEEQYYEILNSVRNPLHKLLGRTYYRKFDNFTQYFMFISLYYRKNIVINKNILVRQVTDLGKKKVNDILFIPNYLDIVRFHHNVYKYLFLFESLIDNYYILKTQYWSTFGQKKKLHSKNQPKQTV